jgi:hypothetical protein
MDAANELDCKVFLEAQVPPADLAKLLADSLSGTLAGPPFAPVVRTRNGEIEIRINDDRDEDTARDATDNFLFFRYALELYPVTNCRHEDKVALVSALLRFLWQRGWPAVAACDYERDLPFAGGSDPSAAPWLSALPGSNGVTPSVGQGSAEHPRGV